MLKTISLPERLTSDKQEVDDSAVNKIGINNNGMEHTKKSDKLKA